MAVQLVWFKKDLRVNDHEPLTRAALDGPVVCVYVIEPEILETAEFDSSHQVFVNDCLTELHNRLLALGNGLVILYGNLPGAFEKLRSEIEFEKIWCHEETGNEVTYKRDLRVQKWCKLTGIGYEELPQTGVIRRLKSREGWAQKWFERMKLSPLEIPATVPAPESSLLRATSKLIQPDECLLQISGFGAMKPLAQIGLPPSTKPLAQVGGEGNAYLSLASFVFERGENYSYELSSPVSGQSSCSRLSPYLTFGAISLRTVYRASVMRRLQLAEAPGNGAWRKNLVSFEKRLIWHCHFMQKLEDEPATEFKNISRGYDGLRENEFREDYFQAWCEGMTGFPMVDACMRYVKQTGWLNFRMRAMLASFAANQLWLHWRPTSIFLAKHFLDFEPGIHYPQFQMHAGTTDMDDMLVYSPAKQAREQDPTGVFIRTYVPELKEVPLEFLHQPELMPPLFQQFHKCVIGEDYPSPIVDNAFSSKQARDRLSVLRKEMRTKESGHEFEKRSGRKLTADWPGDSAGRT